MVNLPLLYCEVPLCHAGIMGAATETMGGRSKLCYPNPKLMEKNLSSAN